MTTLLKPTGPHPAHRDRGVAPARPQRRTRPRGVAPLRVRSHVDPDRHVGDYHRVHRRVGERGRHAYPVHRRRRHVPQPREEFRRPGQRKSFSSSEVALHPDNGRLNFSITTSVGDLTGACPNGQWVPSGTITGSSLAVYQGGVQVL
jgi:hypothetical protein